MNEEHENMWKNIFMNAGLWLICCIGVDEEISNLNKLNKLLRFLTFCCKKKIFSMTFTFTYVKERVVDWLWMITGIFILIMVPKRNAQERKNRLNWAFAWWNTEISLISLKNFKATNRTNWCICFWKSLLIF